MNISIVGGDLRIVRLAEMYANEGKLVYVYGLEKYFKGAENYLNGTSEKSELLNNNVAQLKDEKLKSNDNEGTCNKIYKNIFCCNTLRECIEKSEVIISSVPLSKDKIYISAPFTEQKISLEELKNELLIAKPKKKKFIAGNIPKEFYVEQIENVDLLQSEKLTILNAIPTVEGTIRIVLQEREETIFESNVLICGFGRIGKILCERFYDLGANVYCAARKEADFTWIREKRCTYLQYDQIEKVGYKFDFVINTVPTTVISEKELKKFRKDVLIVDVASNPGGIDKEVAEKYEIKVITALGIPGKDMPKTASKYIKEVIDESILV